MSIYLASAAHLASMIRNDVAEWVSHVFDERIEVEELVSRCEDGTLLCELLNKIYTRMGLNREVQFFKAKRRSKQARKNIDAFLEGCAQVGVTPSKLFNADDLVNRVKESAVVTTLYELGRVQTAYPKPRCIRIGTAMDSNTIRDPGIEENNLLKQSLSDLLENVSYDFASNPVNQLGTSWKFMFGSVGPVPIYFIHDKIVARVDGHWMILERFLRQHGLLVDVRSLNSTMNSLADVSQTSSGIHTANTSFRSGNRLEDIGELSIAEFASSLDQPNIGEGGSRLQSPQRSSSRIHTPSTSRGESSSKRNPGGSASMNFGATIQNPNFLSPQGYSRMDVSTSPRVSPPKNHGVIFTNVGVESPGTAASPSVSPVKNHGVVFTNIESPPSATISRLRVPQTSDSTTPLHHGVLYTDLSPEPKSSSKNLRGSSKRSSPATSRRTTPSTSRRFSMLLPDMNTKYEKMDSDMDLGATPGIGDWIAHTEAQNAGLRAEVQRLRRESDQIKKEEASARIEQQRNAAELEAAHAKLAELTSDNYDERIQQKLNNIQREHVASAEKRESVFHNRLKEQQYFSDLKDTELAAHYAQLFDAACKASESRLQANYIHKISAMDNERIMQLRQLDTTYRQNQERLQAKIASLRKQLREQEENKRTSIGNNRKAVGSALEDITEENGDHWIQLEKSNRKIAELQQKVRDAKNEAIAAKAQAQQENALSLQNHDHLVSKLEKENQDLRNQLHSASSESKKKQIDQENFLRMEHAKQIAALESQLSQKTSALRIREASDASAADSSMHDTNFGTKTIESIQNRCSKLEEENAQLRAKLSQMDLPDNSASKAELDQLKTAHAKALRDIRYEHAEKLAQLEQAKSQVKLDILNLKEQHARELAQLRHSAKSAQRKYEYDSLAEQRRLTDAKADEHLKTITQLKRTHREHLREIEAKHHDAMDELHNKLSEQLRATQSVETELAQSKSALKSAQLAKADIESTMVLGSADEKDLEEAKKRIVDLEVKMDEYEENNGRLLREADEQLRQLTRDHEDAERKLRESHRQALKRQEEAHNESTMQQETVHQQELDRLRKQLEGQVSEYKQQVAELRNDLDTTSREGNKAIQRAIKQEQERANALREAHTADAESLQSELQKARAENAELRAEIIKLKARIAELEALLSAEKQRGVATNAELSRTRANNDEYVRQLESRMLEKDGKVADLELRLEAEMRQIKDRLAESAVREQQAVADACAEAERMKVLAETKAAEAAVAREDLLAATKLAAEEATRRDVAEREADEAKRIAEDAENLARTKLLEEEAELRRQNQKEREQAEAQAREEDAWRKAQAELARLAALKENDEMIPFREDICEWINKMLSKSKLHRLTTPLHPDTLLRDLASGVILCDLAEMIDLQEKRCRKLMLLTEKAGWIPRKSPSMKRKDGSKTPAHKKEKRLAQKEILTPRVPKSSSSKGVAYKPDDVLADKKLNDFIAARQFITLHIDRDADRGTSEARANIREFIRWAQTLGIEDPDIFEEDDLILYKSERHVLFGIYDVARRCRDSVPNFIAFERAFYNPRVRSNLSMKDPVDKAAHEILKECVCNPRMELTKISDANYLITGKEQPVRLVVKGTQVSIRVGGGFDNFRSYLKEHDPCRKNVQIQAAHKKFFELQKRLEGNKRFTKGGEAHVALFTNRLAKTLESHSAKKAGVTPSSVSNQQETPSSSSKEEQASTEEEHALQNDVPKLEPLDI